jgi:hypothetical protein
MNQIVTTSQLRERGYAINDVHRLVRDGNLQRIRRVRMARGAGDGRRAASTLDRGDDAATAARGRPELRVSRRAARPTDLGQDRWRVHLTRPRIGGGRRRDVVEIHTSPLRDDELIMIGSLAVTSLARTVADLARTLPFEQAVAAGDRALALGLDRSELDDALERGRGWPGIRQARRVAAFLDPRSESAGESVSRVRLHEDLLPAPQPQFEVFDSLGYLVARCDFGWDEQRTLGEFDGKIKYETLLQPGETIQDVIYREKLREDALRDLGWQVVRWVWADLYERGVIRDRLLRAFARAASYAH